MDLISITASYLSTQYKTKTVENTRGAWIVILQLCFYLALLAEGAGIQIPSERLSKSIPKPIFPSSDVFLLLYTVAVTLGDPNQTELLHVFQYKSQERWKIERKSIMGYTLL